jgi:hypothetical protein
MTLSRSIRRAALVLMPVLIPLPAHAGRTETAGISLSWDACIDDAASTFDKRFACDVNDTGSPFRLVCSVVPDADISGIESVQTILVLAASDGTVPDWWALSGAGCRLGSINQQAPLGTSTGGTCEKWVAAGLSYGALTAAPVSQGLKITATWYDPSATTSTVLAGHRYVANILAIDQSHTVADLAGDPVCVGCATHMDIALVMITFQRASDSWSYLLPSGAKSVTWQGPSVPTLDKTWGAIKAMYRN